MNRAEIRVILLKATKRKDWLLVGSQGRGYFTLNRIYIALKADDSGI